MLLHAILYDHHDLSLPTSYDPDIYFKLVDLYSHLIPDPCLASASGVLYRTPAFPGFV